MLKDKILNFLRKHIILDIVTLLLFISIGTISFLCINTKNKLNVVFDGIYFENKDVSNMNKEQLKININKYSENKLFCNIKFSYKDYNKVLNLKDIGYYYDTDTLINNIFYEGKESNLIADTIQRLNIKYKKKNFKINLSLNDKLLEKCIDNISSDINIKKKEPKLTFNNGKILSTSGTKGINVNKEELKRLIKENIDNDSIEATIDIPVTEEDFILKEDTIKNMTILGSFATKLPNLTSGRTSNIRLFFSKLNEKIVLPGEIFSVDKTAGSREVYDGYTTAKAFSEGKVVETVAGGICQGATTLYNALLYSDLEIVERHQHSMPVTYIQMGRDATISKGLKDLKFRNNKNYPIIVQTYISSNGYAKAFIWGINEEPNKKIEIVVKKTGSLSTSTYKCIYVNDKLISTKKIHSDKYIPHE